MVDLFLYGLPFKPQKKGAFQKRGTAICALKNSGLWGGGGGKEKVGKSHEPLMPTRLVDILNDS